MLMPPSQSTAEMHASGEAAHTKAVGGERAIHVVTAKRPNASAAMQAMLN